MATLNYPEGKSFAPVWKCIYCGEDATPESLTKEHIIPKALNGTITLPKSSCRKCACITRDFENFCLSKTFIDARTMLGLKTSKKKRPPLKIWNIDSNGREIWREADTSDHPLIFPTLDLGRAGILIGRDQFVDPPMRSQLIMPPTSVERFAKLKNRDNIRFMIGHNEYAKMLAKIAHAFAIANLGLSSNKYFLADYITGKNNNIFHYVGTAVERQSLSEKTLHALSISDVGQYVVVYVTLFYYLGGPTYEIVAAQHL
ncbi:HNH endonuclease [Methylocystis hirsuta]|uniref:HNH endonuclease n=1 Tax=Methylocystis hirsuta TaxID=369798 RepID=A0A3M9XMQ6_9HYPH|nr:HNH endonuclease [Methylocystis hirsuta]RNJ49284.1 HNH endonuclease [Methylocystis hirsuta]